MATMIGTKGAQLDLLIRQGASSGPHSMQLFNPDTSPMDITNVSFAAQIRKTPGAIGLPEATAIFDFVEPLIGKFTWEFVADETAELSAGIDENASDSLHVWDMEMTDSLGRVFPLLYGDVKVFREVTRV